MNSQPEQAKEPSRVGESMINEPLQDSTPVTNIDNHPVAVRRPVSTSEEPSDFITRAVVKAMMKKLKENASASTIGQSKASFSS